MPKAAKSRATITPAVIVFGTDKAKKLRAGWFSKGEAELAAKAAEANAFNILKITTEADRKLAAKLKPGRVHLSGDGFLPVAGRQIFAQLAAVVGVETGSKSSKASSVLGEIQYRGIPTSWDEIGVGHLVIAQESPKDGWYEAIVIARDGDRLKVRWRDYPKLAAFERPMFCIALPCPTPNNKQAD